MDADQLAPPDPGLYERDEHAWLGIQIAALRAGRLEELDCRNLVDFLDAMARNNRRELRSRLMVLLSHLLKLRAQPELLSRSWIGTILTQQKELQALLRDYPSLAHEAERVLAEAYVDAIDLAAGETGLPRDAFPSVSPYTLGQALAFAPPPAMHPLQPAKPRR